MPDGRIGLTGARGVLGARIREAAVAKGLTIDRFEGDVRDVDAVARWVEPLDRVVHAAAMVPVRQVQDHLTAAIATNVAGTANVAQAAARRGACRLTFISTSHVYRSAAEPLNEDGPIAPVSLYGMTKWQGEEWVRTLVPDALVLRVFSFFDARQQPSYLLPGLLDRIRAAPPGASLPIHGAENVRDIADATWLAGRCVDVVDSDASGTVNCCVGRGFGIAEIARRLASAMGRDDIAWRPVQVDAPTALIGSSRRLAGVVGGIPAFDLDEALARFVATAAPRPIEEVGLA